MNKAELEQLREVWRKRITDYRASGQSGAAWCAAHQIKEHQFWYWTRQFPQAKRTSSPRFLPISVGESHPTPAHTSLLIRVGAAAIEVQPGYDPQFLRQLVQTLAEPC